MDKQSIIQYNSGSIAVYYNGTEQKIVIGRDGLMVYHSHSSYLELRKNDSGQPLNVSGIQVGAGWGFGLLWMGYFGENAQIGKSFGPLRAKGAGNISKDGSNYTITFPGGNSAVGTNYAVFCQPAKSTADGRYLTVYGRTSSSFSVACRWSDKQKDADIYFMVISMQGWY